MYHFFAEVEEISGIKTTILMKETAKIQKLITKRGTLEMLIPLCFSAQSIRFKEFRISIG